MNANEALIAAKHGKLLESAVFVIFQSSQKNWKDVPGIIDVSPYDFVESWDFLVGHVVHVTAEAGKGREKLAKERERILQAKPSCVVIAELGAARTDPPKVVRYRMVGNELRAE